MGNSILSEFKSITQIDLESLLKEIEIFLKTDKIMIENYYSGKREERTQLSFRKFDDLENKLENTFEKIRSFKGRFNHYRWWELIELLEQINDSFNSIRNYHRWQKCSISKFGYEGDPVIDYVTKEGQTLEKISANIKEDKDPSNDWYDIAVFNDLREEDYDLNGGKELKLKLNRKVSNFKVDAVVDVIRGKSIYGIDVDRTLSFVEDGDQQTDIKVLDNDKTILQTVDILIGLRKNSNPDFPLDGLQSNVIVGGNRALFNFPILVRQLQQTFATDDTLENFNVKNLGYEQDVFVVEFEVETRLGEIVEQESELR